MTGTRSKPSIVDDVIYLLEGRGSPMHTRELSAEMDLAGRKFNTSWNRIERSVASVLLRAVNKPMHLTRLVHCGRGMYGLEGPVWPQWERDLLTEHAPVTAPVRSEIEQEERETDFKDCMDLMAIWADGEGLLDGGKTINLWWLVNLACQRGQFNLLMSKHQDGSLEELVPYLRQALYDQESGTVTGPPRYVWFSEDEFKKGMATPLGGHLEDLSKLDEVGFRDVVMNVLNQMALYDITEVRKHNTISFRALTFNGEQIAIRGQQHLIPIDEQDVQRLRGALDAADTEGLLVGLGAVTRAARIEAARPGVVPIRLMGMTTMIHHRYLLLAPHQP